MALSEQQVNLNLRGGLDLKTDGRLVIPSKLTLATDVEFEGSNTVINRFGLSQRAVPALAGPVRMFEHSGVPVIEFNDGSTARAPATSVASPIAITDYTGGGAFTTDKFQRIGATTKRIQSVVPVTSGSQSQVGFDVVVSGTKYCVAWEVAGLAGHGAIRYSIRELSTGAELAGGTVSETAPFGTLTYVRPRLTTESVSGNFVLCYARYDYPAAPYDVVGRMLNSATYVLGAEVTLIAVAADGGLIPEAGLGQQCYFDMVQVAGIGFGVAARSCGGGLIYMRSWNTALGAALCAQASLALASGSNNLGVFAAKSGTGLITHAFYATVGGALKGIRQPSNTGTISAEVSIDVINSAGRITVEQDSDSSDLIVVADNVTTTSKVETRCSFVNPATHAVNSLSTFVTNCVIAGRILALRSRYYLPVLKTPTQFQGTVLLLDLRSSILLPYATARLDSLECAQPGSSSTSGIDRAARVPNSHPSAVTYFRYDLNTRLAGVSNETARCIQLATLDLTGQLGDADFNGDKYLAGACPLVFDGSSIVEEGFHWAPEIVGTLTAGRITVAPVATGAGFFDMPAPAAYPATYTLAFTETWQDAQGNWHESGVGFLGSLTITGVANRGINPTILRPFSMKVGRGLTMYRTLPSSANTTLYLAHPGVDVSGSGGVTDTNLPSGETLYTEGGVIGNTPAPSCRQITAFDQRLALIGGGDGSKVYFSKMQSPGFAAEFVSSDSAFQEKIPPSLGRGVGAVEMHGKLVVVCEAGIGAVYGTGPSNTAIGAYAQIQTVAKDVGALWIAPKSVALAAEGVWFQSYFGLRLFTGQQIARDEAGKFIGSEVDSLVNGAEAAVTLPGGVEQQTRFFLRSTALMWDQTWGQFTSFTRHANVDACLVAGDYFIVTSAAQLQYRDVASVIDSLAAQSVKGVIQTSHLQFGSIQGFQRVREMVILGTSGSAAPTVDLAVGYNGEAVAAEVSGIAPAVSAANVLQFIHQFFVQKCSSMQVKITFWASNGIGRIRLTDLALSVAVKKGTWKSAEIK